MTARSSEKDCIGKGGTLLRTFLVRLESRHTLMCNTHQFVDNISSLLSLRLECTYRENLLPSFMRVYVTDVCIETLTL